MWILWVLITLFQLVILLMLSGILFSVAAISRLMEIIIILVNPTAVFLLRQSANLIIFLTILTAKMTCSVYHKLHELVKCDQEEAIKTIAIPSQEPLQALKQKVAPLQINLRAPFVPYKRSVLEEITIYPFMENESIAGPSIGPSIGCKKIIEPLQDHSHDNNMEKFTECKNTGDDD
ncbi:PREDICTED: uncharacterized protein LOC106741550 [Dinoponera quadriceps]|uniref:Uncharacterized protein LOC106741550 n=1 Tax=Dinoponera quadriceps TaxID=609295 RepID=A0A6P3WSS6_DINQU|nr:PREDICTED: uncharacterized protein LOC106741550 [Dinoponera quadriceps]